MSNSLMGRLDGRLFAQEGRICMVVETNETSGLGRISYSINGQRHLKEMPLNEISRRVSAGANLVLEDNPSNAPSRIVRESDGWFFKAREGLKGPFGSAEEAENGLNQYIVSAQSNGH